MTVTLALMVADMAVLIYFIHHTASAIQLPNVIASIAVDLSEAIEAQGAGHNATTGGGPERGLSSAELLTRMDTAGWRRQAADSGYVQFIRLGSMVGFAAQANAVISLHHRPGHFIVQGHTIGTVWPPEAAAQVNEALARAHITGPYRTLTQDVSFGIDQLVEIAIRALSPAVNDTFTAITCVDWLGDSLCKIVRRWHPARVHRDDQGFIRVIAAQPSYERLVQRSFEKIRQASMAMPAIMIRQLDAIAQIMMETSGPGQRRVLLDQAGMIQRASERTVSEEADRADVRRNFEAVLPDRHRARRPGAGREVITRCPTLGGCVPPSACSPTSAACWPSW